MAQNYTTLSLVTTTLNPLNGSFWTYLDGRINTIFDLSCDLYIAVWLGLIAVTILVISETIRRGCHMAFPIGEGWLIKVEREVVHLSPEGKLHSLYCDGKNPETCGCVDNVSVKSAWTQLSKDCSKGEGSSFNRNSVIVGRITQILGFLFFKVIKVECATVEEIVMIYGPSFLFWLATLILIIGAITRNKYVVGTSILISAGGLLFHGIEADRHDVLNLISIICAAIAMSCVLITFVMGVIIHIRKNRTAYRIDATKYTKENASASTTIIVNREESIRVSKIQYTLPFVCLAFIAFASLLIGTTSATSIACTKAQRPHYTSNNVYDPKRYAEAISIADLENTMASMHRTLRSSMNLMVPACATCIQATPCLKVSGKYAMDGEFQLTMAGVTHNLSSLSVGTKTICTPNVTRTRDLFYGALVLRGTDLVSQFGVILPGDFLLKTEYLKLLMDNSLQEVHPSTSRKKRLVSLAAVWCITCVSKSSFETWRNEIQGSMQKTLDSVKSLNSIALDQSAALKSLKSAIEVTVNNSNIIEHTLHQLDIKSAQNSRVAFNIVLITGHLKVLKDSLLKTYQIADNLLTDMANGLEPVLSRSYINQGVIDNVFSGSLPSDVKIARTFLVRDETHIYTIVETSKILVTSADPSYMVPSMCIWREPTAYAVSTGTVIRNVGSAQSIISFQDSDTTQCSEIFCGMQQIRRIVRFDPNNTSPLFDKYNTDAPLGSAPAVRLSQGTIATDGVLVYITESLSPRGVFEASNGTATALTLHTGVNLLTYSQEGRFIIEGADLSEEIAVFDVVQTEIEYQPVELLDIKEFIDASPDSTQLQAVDFRTFDAAMQDADRQFKNVSASIADAQDLLEKAKHTSVNIQSELDNWSSGLMTKITLALACIAIALAIIIPVVFYIKISRDVAFATSFRRN